MSPVVQLVQGGEGFLVLVPAYHDGQPHATPAERRAALRGLGTAAYAFDRLVGLALSAGTPLEVNTAVVSERVAAAGGGADAERSTMNSAWSLRSVREGGGSGAALDLIPDQATGEPGGWYLRISPAAGASWMPHPLWPWLGSFGVATLTALWCLLILRTAKTRELADDLRASNNNLIMGIMGGLGVLEERCPDDTQARRALGLIERGATRAAELTRQLLAYAGREHAAAEATALDELVRDMVPLLETSAGRRVSLALHVEPAAAVVQADATQLRQIVMNLVINAAEAMSGGGGTVEIRVGCRAYERAALAAAWPANELPAGRYVFLEVGDTGCGMSRETRQRIFEPFFTTKFTGRGLGLAAVLGIVRAHGGAILVESALGHGSTFAVLLPPLPVSMAAAAPVRPRADLWRGSGTVLIVDDEALARDVTADMVRAIGFVAVVTADGDEALARLDGKDAAFAAVILDLTMPGRGGLEVHRELRRRDPALPILLVSGYSVHDAGAALGNGAPTRFLQKPFRLVELANALRDLLARRP